MAPTSKQAALIAYLLPMLALVAAAAIAAKPALMQAHKQFGNTEQSRQMTAIGQDIIANRCYQMARAPVKGELVDIPTTALHASCVQGQGWYGFLAVLNGQTTVVEVFTQVQIKNTLTTLQGK